MTNYSIVKNIGQGLLSRNDVKC